MKYSSIILTAAMAGLLGISPAVAEPAAPEPASVRHPFFDDCLYPQWSALTPEAAKADILAAIRLGRERQEALRRVKPDEATFDNVFGAYERMTYELERADTALHHLSSVMDNDQLRDVQESLIPELSAFGSGITADEQLWHVIKNAAAQPWVQQLSPAKQRFVRQVVDSFRDSGADLSPDKKARLAQVREELSRLMLQFNKNVLDSTKAWEWLVEDPELLKGMSPDWMARAQHEALQKGYGSAEKPAWLITLDAPSAREVIYSCDVESTRKKCWEGITTIGKREPYDNAPIVARVMELRKELAELLGFANFADMQLARRMAGSGARAMAFVDEMMQKVKPAFDAEVAELSAYISRCKGEPAEKLNPWDTSYYMRKLSKERYNFDPETLRPYQEVSHVLKGMFSIFQGLYDITIKNVPSCCPNPGETCPAGVVEVWHPEVKVFAVYDNKSGAHLGSFYMDIFPRTGKRAGAWVLPLNYGTPAHDGLPHAPHLATLAANASPATADKPALLSHYDVETLFHEFGHMMHALLGDTELMSHCGTSVAWDFVELPSQMNENWTWEPQGIATYAVHYQTGEPIPASLIEKMQQSRFFFPAHDNMSQLCIAKLDMEMHINYDAKFKGRDLDSASQQLLAPWRAPLSVAPNSLMRQLTHCITGGYAAGYYSYKWAEVLAADVFTRFQKEGVLNPATGAAYRECILSKGDSKPAAEIYRDFMHRDPNPDALLQKQGLLPPSKD